MHMKSSFLKDMQERGLFVQCTNLHALDERMTSSTTAYLGFDATAPCLHVGSLMQIMILRMLQEHGHRPVVLLGGATTSIGDPTGKNTMRPTMDACVIQNNIKALETLLGKLLLPHPQPLFCNNMQWFSDLRYMDFLHTYARHFTLHKMLSLESVRLRLERKSPMTLLEFHYMVAQSIDFLFLYQEHGCSVQIGGSDQWGNIINGVDLVRRIQGAEVFGLTTPLLTTASGSKMGKTERGAIWLEEKHTSAVDFWQFWRNCADTDVLRFINFFAKPILTDVPALNSAQHYNSAKEALANHITTLVHGASVCSEVQDIVHASFQSHGLHGLIAHDVDCRSCVDILVTTTLAPSKSAARRLIANGAVCINGEKMIDTTKVFSDDAFPFRLSCGKKHHIAVYTKNLDCKKK